MDLIHKHLIVTGHFDTVNPLMWPWPKLHDLNDHLLKELDMKVLSGPHIARCDDRGNEGWTMMTAITTSHIILHTWDTEDFQLDIYSCKKYNIKTVLKVFEENNFYSKKEQLIDRPFIKKDC